MKSFSVSTVNSIKFHPTEQMALTGNDPKLKHPLRVAQSCQTSCGLTFSFIKHKQHTLMFNGSKLTTTSATTGRGMNMLTFHTLLFFYSDIFRNGCPVWSHRSAIINNKSVKE